MSEAGAEVAGETGQDADDVFRAADAAEHLVDAEAEGAMETGAGLRHQAQIRGRGILRWREVIRRSARTEVVELRIEDVPLRGICPHLVFGDGGPAGIGERPEGHELQAVTGRADLGVDLKPPLQLRLVVGPQAEQTSV